MGLFNFFFASSEAEASTSSAEVEVAQTIAPKDIKIEVTKQTLVRVFCEIKDNEVIRKQFSLIKNALTESFSTEEERVTFIQIFCDQELIENMMSFHLALEKQDKVALNAKVDFLLNFGVDLTSYTLMSIRSDDTDMVEVLSPLVSFSTKNILQSRLEEKKNCFQEDVAVIKRSKDVAEISRTIEKIKHNLNYCFGRIKREKNIYAHSLFNLDLIREMMAHHAEAAQSDRKVDVSLTQKVNFLLSLEIDLTSYVVLSPNGKTRRLKAFSSQEQSSTSRMTRHSAGSSSRKLDWDIDENYIPVNGTAPKF